MNETTWADDMAIKFAAKSMDEQLAIVEAFHQLFEAVDVCDYQQYQREMYGEPGDDESEAR